MTEAQCGNLTAETKKLVGQFRYICFHQLGLLYMFDIVFLDQVNTEAASMLEDILLLENVGPIVLCRLAGPFSDRWLCFIFKIIQVIHDTDMVENCHSYSPAWG